MKSTIFITYIVPCYNIEKQLPRCVESLERQHLEDSELEFIMVNDGSTDNTLTVIKQFAERDDRVIVVDQENQGVCKARNNALKLVHGQYVFFLDGDDYLTEDASKIMYKFCKNSMPDIAVYGMYKVYENKQNSTQVWFDSRSHIAPGYYDKKTYIENAKIIPVSFKLYNFKFLKKNHIIFDEHLLTGEVFTFFIHTLTLADTIGISPDFIMYYLKRSDNSATSVISVERDMSIIDTLHVITKYVYKNDPLLIDNRSFVISFFWIITAFSTIKYATRTKYTSQVGGLLSVLKSDKDYDRLLRFLTSSKGFRIDKYSLMAAAIKYLPIRVCYDIMRASYFVMARIKRTENHK